MGAGHHRESRPDSQDDKNYNFGMQITGTPYHTIMALEDVAGEFPSHVGIFSSNTVGPTGIRIGDANNDNSRTITENRFLIAMVGDESGQCPSDKFKHREESSYFVEWFGLVFLIICTIMILPLF
jgi:hypothetical protein